MNPHTHNNKLTTDQVHQVRAMDRAGFSGCSLSHAFKISQQAISRIITRRCWPLLPLTLVRLPMLTPEQATKLRFKRLIDPPYELQKRWDAYQVRLASQLPESEREAFINTLKQCWHARKKPTKKIQNEQVTA